MAKSELEFVLEMVHPDHFGAVSKAIEAPPFVEESISWNQCLSQANRLGVSLPFLVNLDRATWKSELPEGISLKLKENLQKELLRLALIENELERVSKTFAQDRIPTIVLGGLDFGKRFYPETLYRPSESVDVLVPKEHYMNALRSLGRSGYRLFGQQQGDMKTMTVSKRTGAQIVTVHQQLFADDTDTELDIIWERSVQGGLKGLPPTARALPVEEAIVWSIRSAAQFGKIYSPVWLSDLSLMVQSTEKLDWERILWQLAEKGALVMGWFAFSILRKSYGVRVPQKFLQSSSAQVGFLRRMILSRNLKLTKWFNQSENWPGLASRSKNSIWWRIESGD